MTRTIRLISICALPVLLAAPDAPSLGAEDEAAALAARLRAFTPRAPGVVIEEEWTRPEITCTPIRARGVFYAGANSKVMRRPRVELEVNFPFGSAELTAAAVDQLEVLAGALEDPTIQNDRFLLVGHTDAVGDDARNQALSEARAQAVERHLVEVHGIDAGRVRARGCGEASLKDPDDPNSPVNRRVEVVNAGR